MAKRHAPRRGSLQYWPRKRSKRAYARVKNWSKLKNTKVLGFAGYKVGMTHVLLKDNTQNTSKGEIISRPATIVECPPLKVLGLRFYKKTIYGFKAIGDVYSKKVDKELLRKMKPGKADKIPEVYDDVRLIVYTQPRLTGIGKKKPEVFELALSGVKEERLKLAQEFLDKEIKVSDVFKEGQFLDMHAVSKGKGFQGTVKRFGVTIRQHKSEKVKRGTGNLGAWTPKKVSWRVPQTGKMGYHLRTEYNLWLLKMSNEEITPKSGFKNYGVVKNDYVLIQGSIPGSRKRLIIMTEPMRFKGKNMEAEITYIKK